MIALDTNVLVRFLVAEPGAEEQAQAVRAALQAAVSAKERLFIPLVTLVETIWVLRRAYRQPKPVVIALVERLCDHGSMLLEEGDLVDAALAAWRDGVGDFSDHVIGQEALRGGCHVVLSFDRQMRGSPLFCDPADYPPGGLG